MAGFLRSLIGRRRSWIGLLFVVFITLAVFLFFIGVLTSIFGGGGFFSIFVNIPAGHTGVVYSIFGGVQDFEFSEGWHFKAPWESVTLYSVRTQEMLESASVPSEEGLIVKLDVSILYSLRQDKASDVHKTVGMGYPYVVIAPQLRSIIRGITAEYEAKALYTAGREEVANRIYEQLEPSLNERGIVLEKVLLRDVELPAKIKDAIEEKLDAEQQAERMKFVLEKEELEKQRKIIEAEGIAEANRIIGESLNENYLTWYWIDKLQVASIHYVPVGDRGLPLFKPIGVNESVS